MSKKSNSLGILYLIGCALAVLGFCLPMFKVIGQQVNGIDFINFKNFNFVTIGALLIFVGAILGVVSVFVPQLKSFKTIFLLVSIAGGIVLVLGIYTATGLKGAIYKGIAKNFLKSATYGFYILIIGWISSLVGIFSK